MSGGLFDRLHLREARNVDEAKQRDAIVRRFRRLRQEAEIELATIEHWNRKHPGEPIDEDGSVRAYYRECIAWCDGEGPMPALVARRRRGARMSVHREPQSTATP